MTPFDFGAFEREAGQLLAQMRKSAAVAAEYESQAKSGRLSTSEASRAAEPAGAAAGGSKSAEAEIRSRGLATDQLVTRQKALTSAEQDASRAESQLAQNMAQSRGSLRTTGALTNEFVDEAKRGAVTIREIGQEVSGTISKFGGWIVAGGAVYFAFDALSDVKRGAIDAASGVEQMSRVINNLDISSATDEVKELANEFNLPISSVTETAFGIGKAYHNQAQALLATKSALYAVKVGELDAGTATKYLISIINGFHLPASAMAGLFDQLLTAQKRYAIDLPSLMAGVGRAAGSFRAAGGDVHTLIALITTLQHVSGQQGNVIGTTIQRSPHFLAMPQNQSVLKQFGVDPNQDIEQVYSEAINAAQGKSGNVQREIAEALFGPQNASRVGIFLLQNKKLFDEVLKQTSPKHAKGAAEEQLEIVLSKASEKIDRIGHQLEQIGLGLARGHLLDSLGLALQTINELLSVANSLLGAFDSLPDGAQKLLAYLIQASLVIKTLRRLNLGETIAGQPQGQVGGVRGGAARFFGYESKDSFAKEARAGFINEQQALQKELSKITTRQYTAGREETAAFKRARETDAAVGPAVKQYGALSPEAAAAKEKAVGAARTATAAAEASEKLAIKEEAAVARLAAIQESIVATRKKVVGGLNAEATIAEAQRLGYPVPAGFEKDPLAGTRKLGATQREVEAINQATKGVVPAGAAEEAGRTSAVVGGAAGKVKDFSSKVGGVKGAVSSLGGAFSGLLGRAGELAFAAFTIGLLSELLTDQADKVGDEFESISAASKSPKARLDRLHQLKKGSQAGEGGETFSDRLDNLITERTKVLGVDVPTLGLGPGKGIGEEREELEAQAAHTIEAELKAQRSAKRKGEPVPFRYISDIRKDIQRVQKSNLGRKQTEEALEKYEEELLHSYAGGKDHNNELAAAQAEIQKAGVETAKGKDLVEKLQNLKASQITERLSSNAALIGGSEGVAYDPAIAHKLALIYEAQVQKLGGATDAKSLSELASARQTYFSAIETAVSSELQYGLDTAKTQGQRSAAYQQALSRYKHFAGSSGADYKKQKEQVEQLEKRRQQVAAQQQEEEGNIHSPGIDATKLPGNEELKKLDTRLQAEKGKLKALADEENQKQRFVRQIIQKLREEQFQANSALRQAEEGAREALTADPVVQTREKIEFLGKEIAQAIKVYGKDSQQVFQLITERRQAQQTLIQDQLGLIQAHGQLATAGILQQVPREKSELYGPGGLLAQLRFEQAHRNAFDPKQIIEIEAQVKQAQAQLEFDVVQEATQLADARFGIREAQAQYKGNGAQAAKIALDKAKYDLAHAQTPQEKLAAQQSVIQAVGAKRDAVAQAKLESIEFEANIAKTTTQDEIEQLENLLHTYKLSMAMRRQIREQIHSLKGQLSSEGDAFNLNVGDFSLPTAYDIRRAVLSGGSGGQSPQVNQSNSFHIENYSSDPNVVGRAIGRALGGAAHSAALSAGVAG